ncbi:hypothetical protein LCGC14_2985490 [marine sediment metagenome]|uniref:Uncharacterized protein n=1 Tax=marine sediment metagenome TaxID=412755 RepID=A0A0F8ZWH9_9ZZZZ
MVFAAGESQQSIGELRATPTARISPGARRLEIKRLSIIQKRYGPLRMNPQQRARLEELQRLKTTGFVPSKPIALTPGEFRAAEHRAALSAEVVSGRAAEQLRARGFTVVTPGIERLTPRGAAVQKAVQRTGVLLGRGPARPSRFAVTPETISRKIEVKPIAVFKPIK